MSKQKNRPLIQLTEDEEHIVEQRLETSLSEAVYILQDVLDWALEFTTPDEFESRFVEFAQRYRLAPAWAEVAASYVLNYVADDEEIETDRRGFELMFRKRKDAWDETDQQTWAAF